MLESPRQLHQTIVARRNIFAMAADKSELGEKKEKKHKKEKKEKLEKNGISKHKKEKVKQVRSYPGPTNQIC